MIDDFPYERLEGVRQKIENELAYATEHRIYVCDENGTRIGKATQLTQPGTSSYLWRLTDVMLNKEPPPKVRVIVEDWTLDAVVFLEGFGFIMVTTRTEPTNISFDKTLHVRNGQTAFCFNDLYMYRIITLEDVEPKEKDCQDEL
jgi:hypothetical protein